MRSTLDMLWMGELCPGEMTPENSSNNPKEVDEIIQNIKENKEKLKKLLNDEQNAILKELIQDLHFLYLMKRSEDFKKGFSLASKLLAEAFYHQ